MREKDYRGKYKLTHEEYIATKRIVANYASLIDEYNSTLHASATNDGQPHGSGISDTTGQKAIKLAEMSKKIIAVNRAIDKLPQEYKMPIFEHLAYKKPYTVEASKSTLRRWQYRFIYWVYMGVKK